MNDDESGAAGVEVELWASLGAWGAVFDARVAFVEVEVEVEGSS